MKSFHASAVSGLALFLAVPGLLGCGRDGAAALPSLPGDAAPPAHAEPQFLNPPQPTLARRGGATVTVAGHAPAGAQVRLANPDGQQLSTQAAQDGGWRLVVPVTDAPRLYAVSAVAGGRVLRGEGALAVLPAPGPAALLLRAGAPALALDGDGQSDLSLEAVDVDGGGGLAVAGVALAQAALRLSLDGRPAAAGQGDAGGRYGLLAVQGDLKPGPHALRLEGAGRILDRTIETTVSPPPPGRPYAVRRMEGGWRIDWATPGGGVQTTLAFDRDPGAAS